MCFSPEADLIAGALLLPVGVASLRSVRHRGEVLFGALPVLFAAHQLVETLVWRTSLDLVSAGVAHAAAVAYVVFAFPVLPVLIPLSLLLLEPGEQRSRMWPFLGLGGVVSVWLALLIVRNGVDVTQEAHALAYDVGLRNPLVWAALYILAVTAPALLSGYRAIVLFGVANLVGLSIVGLAYQQGFASLWCFWAAATSVLILVHLRRRHTPGRTEALAG